MKSRPIWHDPSPGRALPRRRLRGKAAVKHTQARFEGARLRRRGAYTHSVYFASSLSMKSAMMWVASMDSGKDASYQKA